MKEIHVYPVPGGMTAEDAFDELEIYGEFVEYRWWRPRFRWPWRRWAVMEVERG